MKKPDAMVAERAHGVEMTPLELKTKPVETRCKGLVFRGYHSQFVQDGRIGDHQGIRLLKRKSCPGCEICGWDFDDAKERVDTLGITFPIGGIKHGQLYTLKATNIDRDWETGYIDDWDLEIVPLPEENKP